MFESLTDVGKLAADLQRMVDRVGDCSVSSDAPTALALIGAVETAKATLAALQARQAAVYCELREQQRRAEGVAAERVRQGIAEEVALAKRCSPHAGRSYLAFVRRLVEDLPRTMQALRSGVTSEWRAMLVARETGFLSAADRSAVDAVVGPQLPRLGDRQVEAAARRAAYRVDPQGAVDRLRAATADRRVTLRPAPDTMTRLTALLPVAQGVAAFAALSAAADTATASGDPRSRGQVMADTMVERLTGQVDAADVPITVNVVVTDQALLRQGQGAEEPGEVEGYGPVPAWLARRLASPDIDAPVSLRRLFTDVSTGRLVTMETGQRRFTEAQRQFIRLRDGHCSTPYCDAPIRHVDHVVPHQRGGPTRLDNAQGLCEACNYAKEAVRYRIPAPRSRAPAA